MALTGGRGKTEVGEEHGRSPGWRRGEAPVGGTGRGRGPKGGTAVDTGLTHRGFMTGVSARVESFLEEGVENKAMGPAGVHPPQG